MKAFKIACQTPWNLINVSSSWCKTSNNKAFKNEEEKAKKEKEKKITGKKSQIHEARDTCWAEP